MLTPRKVMSPDEHPRSSLGIYLKILETVRDEGPSRSSIIIRAANLSHGGFTKYLETLLSRGLLMEEVRTSVGRSYALTAKGLDFVNQLKVTESFLAGLGLSL